MTGSKEQYEEMQQQRFNLDCSGNLYEEWLREEPDLGAEHSVFVAIKKQLVQDIVDEHDIQTEHPNT